MKKSDQSECGLDLCKKSVCYFCAKVGSLALVILLILSGNHPQKSYILKWKMNNVFLTYFYSNVN